MRNSGSTAMYYEWERVEVSAGLGTTAVVDAAAQYFTPSAKGCILPNTSVAMRFTFKPVKPGIFREEWKLKLTPPMPKSLAPVLLRGVCLSAPERTQQVRTLGVDLQRRKDWFSIQDILDRHILPEVYRRTIPDSVRVDAVVRPLATPVPHPASLTASPATETAEAAARFAAFTASYGAAQGLSNASARTCFADLNAIAALVPTDGSGGDAAPSDGSVQVWDGDVSSLESLLAELDASGVALRERFEAALQRAVSATPDVGRSLRLRHAAAACAEAMLGEAADRAVRTRELYSKSPEGITGPVSGSAQLARRGSPMAWCWETGRYETAAEVARVGAAARQLRRDAEQAADEQRRWEESKLSMSKRERKKAEEKERKEAEAAAAAAATTAAAEEVAREAAARAEAERLADPAVQKELRYDAGVEGQVRASVDAMLGSFLEHALAIDKEASLG